MSDENAVASLLDELRLEFLEFGTIELEPGQSVCIPHSLDMRCYMVESSTIRIRIGQAEDVIITVGDHAVLADGSAHTLENLDASSKVTIWVSRERLNPEHYGALLRLLPSVIVDRGCDGNPSAKLAPLVALIEKTRMPLDANDMVIVKRLAELTFIHTVRRHLDEIVGSPENWKLGHAFFKIAPSLVAMRTDLNQNWTLNALAKTAGLSKTAFVHAFSHAIGKSPLRHLADLRMARASALLRESTMSPAQIAHTVGYKDSVAFTRAFKRYFGIPPVAYRTSHSED